MNTNVKNHYIGLMTVLGLYCMALYRGLAPPSVVFRTFLLHFVTQASQSAERLLHDVTQASHRAERLLHDVTQASQSAERGAFYRTPIINNHNSLLIRKIIVSLPAKNL